MQLLCLFILSPPPASSVTMLRPDAQDLEAAHLPSTTCGRTGPSAFHQVLLNAVLPCLTQGPIEVGAGLWAWRTCHCADGNVASTKLSFVVSREFQPGWVRHSVLVLAVLPGRGLSGPWAEALPFLHSPSSTNFFYSYFMYCLVHSMTCLIWLLLGFGTTKPHHTPGNTKDLLSIAGACSPGYLSEQESSSELVEGQSDMRAIKRGLYLK